MGGAIPVSMKSESILVGFMHPVMILQSGLVLGLASAHGQSVAKLDKHIQLHSNINIRHIQPLVLTVDGLAPHLRVNLLIHN